MLHACFVAFSISATHLELLSREQILPFVLSFSVNESEVQENDTAYRLWPYTKHPVLVTVCKFPSVVWAVNTSEIKTL